MSGRELSDEDANFVRRMTAIPGGADRAITAARRLRTYFTLTAILGGCTAGLFMLLRTLLKNGSAGLPAWSTPWATWLIGSKK